MGIRRGILWLLRLGGWVYLLTFLAVVGWSFFWPERNISELPHADVVVCLGSGHNKDGSIGKYSLQRAQTCTDLVIYGDAEKVIMTGASQIEESVAEMMATVARTAGLDDAVVVEEREARSTLQNALFSMQYLDASEPVYMVTDSFHLPRSWLSFHWAGYEHLILVPAQASEAERWVWPRPKSLLREPLAIWFNLIRGTLWTVANRFGVDNTAWLM